MSYSYEACFWDPNDNGVNILLGHISQGIRSCDSMIHFFKQRSELEKDYARRLGAITGKLDKDIGTNMDYGKLNETFNVVLSVEKARAQSHSKQSEILFRQIYTDTKAFAANLQARYTTLSGKIERLRMDKFNKKKGCEVLQKKLQDAQIRFRDLQLNENNMIGAKRVEHNKRELLKWESNSQEYKVQLDVLKQEYKASQKFWIHEWAQLSCELQEMENARISFLQSKLQQFATSSMETYILEQTKMDMLTNHLNSFTAADEISTFSKENGTGRLKHKNSKGDMNSSANWAQMSSISTASKKSESYMDNIRKLSFQLKETENKRKLASVEKYEKPLPSPEVTMARQFRNSTPVIRNEAKSVVEPTLSLRSSPVQIQSNVDESTIRGNLDRPRPTVQEEQLKSDEDSKNSDGNCLMAHKRNQSLTSPSESSSSNPTDFSHIKKRQSMESMTTSVSSMANSIDESQRFAKSWNSSNRKRKSMSHLQVTSSASSRSDNGERTSNSELKRDENDYSTMRDTSASTILFKPPVAVRGISKGHTHRQSMIMQDSSNPIEDALYEMERIQSSSKTGMKTGNIMNERGMVRDNGITVTLPIVTSEGFPVIEYAKAMYPLVGNEAPGLANFHKGDYLLITEIVNKDWYKGEVYDNDRIDRDHRVGLIPYNFIQLLHQGP
ncbi:Hof1p [Saccharomyces cerevisiae YJM1078]|nr:Hof1p [Saccharomyces cerevisiae YJM1078]AJS63652.1 Hof1p [Saccharomyces cerevisiae YJM248]CAI4674652.1 AIE_G0040700.mRNA.1.CDS.1 [Saccharomyces cerevisiae]CAI6833572.1 AIE_G0040700.mRNA.1.CDS.1 [Saccharomyces cerevisiae]